MGAQARWRGVGSQGEAEARHVEHAAATAGVRPVRGRFGLTVKLGTGARRAAAERPIAASRVKERLDLLVIGHAVQPQYEVELLHAAPSVATVQQNVY